MLNSIFSTRCGMASHRAPLAPEGESQRTAVKIKLPINPFVSKSGNSIVGELPLGKKGEGRSEKFLLPNLTS
ncbi:MAG: hypothetical protein RBR35_06480 [Salinivirgaceae bacterium]|nr:hypothetical protein [Salinivirgaceae bacterium]